MRARVTGGGYDEKRARTRRGRLRFDVCENKHVFGNVFREPKSRRPAVAFRCGADDDGRAELSRLSDTVANRTRDVLLTIVHRSRRRRIERRDGKASVCT